jgi:GDPmannose 4,6-dehydratase
MKKALITGVTGQDGAYLANFLLEKGYKVFGTRRRSSSANTWRLEYFRIIDNPNFNLIDSDITDLGDNIRLLESCAPDEVYNLAAQSFVGTSFYQPKLTAEITGLGTLTILEAVRIVNKKIKFYQASSSEMFGKVQQTPQSEKTNFYPRSPYAVAKLFAHWSTINYRESFDMFTACGILFNHESPLRGEEFVTKKITKGLSNIKLGKQKVLYLGNLNAKRDWGHAKDYVRAMWLMLQSQEPDDYVISTGRTETIKTFINLSCKNLGFKTKWQGQGLDEQCINIESGDPIIKINEKFFRPNEVDLLIGDSSKAQEKLGWKTTSSLEELCQEMVDFDLGKK